MFVSGKLHVDESEARIPPDSAEVGASTPSAPPLRRKAGRWFVHQQGESTPPDTVCQCKLLLEALMDDENMRLSCALALELNLARTSTASLRLASCTHILVARFNFRGPCIQTSDGGRGRALESGRASRRSCASRARRARADVVRLRPVTICLHGHPSRVADEWIWDSSAVHAGSARPHTSRTSCSPTRRGSSISRCPPRHTFAFDAFCMPRDAALVQCAAGLSCRCAHGCEGREVPGYKGNTHWQIAVEAGGQNEKSPDT
ncbi:hypothetical protein EVG20_g5708 [Dentipellis fragilis]|uniref:Uncharacterized protein n=1 Tax=Dentipellis fragilis TaxID=205917 RepID=A0A4Y9YTT3_9AGAM|nr:hypothetical protein EVG20_g5708 [Dentipellis fragilis]